MQNRYGYKMTAGMRILMLSAAISILLFAAGCRTRREIVLDRTDTANMSFEYGLMPEEMRLGEDEEGSFALWNRTTHQSHHILQLAPDSALKERYNRNHDLTILGAGGRAIVSVQGMRHIVTPGVAVFVPRMHSYAVIPHESPGDFVAVFVYSPPFDGRDTLVLER